MDLPAMPWLVLGVAVALVVGWYLSFSAARLDRLHGRLEGARSALDAQLVRRASVSLQLATSGLLDPATSLLLAAAAHEARDAPEGAEPGFGESDGDREVAESNLTRALRAAFDDPEVAAEMRRDPVGAELVHELAASCLRVQLARRFLNDAVLGTRLVRRKWVVRSLRLAGHARWPQTFELDDTPPDTLNADPSRPSGSTLL